MRINNNLMAMNTHRAMGSVQSSQAKSMEKLSSGYRINRAGDDAAGLAISEKMRGQIRGLNQASRNSQDGISMIQTAEGALNETQAILQRMRELAVQSANDTNVDADRTSIQNEIDQLSTEITRISDTTEFNTQKLLNGGLDDVKFQIGANEGQDMGLSIGNMSADALNVISDTVTLGSNGEAIEGVTADAEFDIEGATLSAAAGGAVAAKLDAKDAGLKDAGYAEDISFTYANGVTNAGNVTFNGQNKIELNAAADVPWDDITTSGGAGTIVIGGSGDKLTVKINVSGSGGLNQIDISDAVDANEDGTYSYDAHGIKFDLTADDFTSLVPNDVTIALATVEASGVSVDFTDGTGAIDVLSNMTQTISGNVNKAEFSGGGVALDATDSEWLGADTMKIVGANLSATDGTASITVTLYSGGSGGTALSTDTYILSGTGYVSGGADSFTYDEHGVNFKIDLHAATAFTAGSEIDFSQYSADIANTNKFTFEISADDGSEIKFSGAYDAAGEMSLDDIAAEINTAANAAATAAGTAFTGNVASVVNGSIQIKSTDTGADAEVNVIDAGGLSNIFTTADAKTGSDTSAVLTLTEADGDTTTATVSATDTKAIFTDSDGKQAEFKLKGYSSFDGVNIPEAFSAGDIERSTAGIDVSTQAAASEAITTINDAIESVSKERSKLGAVQNRLEHTIANLDTSAENLQASESRIRDVDMAKEMMEFTKNNILQQAAQSMLAQANQAPQGVLQLLR